MILSDGLCTKCHLRSLVPRDEHFTSQCWGASFEISQLVGGIQLSCGKVIKQAARVLLVEQDGWQHWSQICTNLWNLRIQIIQWKNGYCRISVKRGKAVAEKKGGAGVDDWVNVLGRSADTPKLAWPVHQQKLNPFSNSLYKFVVESSIVGIFARCQHGTTIFNH